MEQILPFAGVNLNVLKFDLLGVHTAPLYD